MTKKQSEEGGLLVYQDGQHLTVILTKNEFWLTLFGKPRIFCISDIEDELQLDVMTELKTLEENRFYKGYQLIKQLESIMN